MIKGMRRGLIGEEGDCSLSASDGKEWILPHFSNPSGPFLSNTLLPQQLLAGIVLEVALETRPEARKGVGAVSGAQSNRLFQEEEWSQRVGVCVGVWWGEGRGRGYTRLTGAGSSPAARLRLSCPLLGGGR